MYCNDTRNAQSLPLIICQNASFRNQKYHCISNSYTMGCPPVRGDNPRALASGLSYVQADKHGMSILYHLHQCRPCTSQEIFRAKVGKGGITIIIMTRFGFNMY